MIYIKEFDSFSNIWSIWKVDDQFGLRFVVSSNSGIRKLEHKDVWTWDSIRKYTSLSNMYKSKKYSVLTQDEVFLEMV